MASKNFPRLQTRPLRSAIGQAFVKIGFGALYGALAFAFVALIASFTPASPHQHFRGGSAQFVFGIIVAGALTGSLIGLLTAEALWQFVWAKLPSAVVVGWALLGAGIGFAAGVVLGMCITIVMHAWGTEIYMQHAMMRVICGACTIIGLLFCAFRAADSEQGV